MGRRVYSPETVNLIQSGRSEGYDETRRQQSDVELEDDSQGETSRPPGLGGLVCEDADLGSVSQAFRTPRN